MPPYYAPFSPPRHIDMHVHNKVSGDLRDQGTAHDVWRLSHLPLCFAGLTMQQEEEAGSGARSALCAVDNQSQRAANAPRLAALDAAGVTFRTRPCKHWITFKLMLMSVCSQQSMHTYYVKRHRTSLPDMTDDLGGCRHSVPGSD